MEYRAQALRATASQRHRLAHALTPIDRHITASSGRAHQRSSQSGGAVWRDQVLGRSAGRLFSALIKPSGLPLVESCRSQPRLGDWKRLAGVVVVFPTPAAPLAEGVFAPCRIVP